MKLNMRTRDHHEESIPVASHSAYYWRYTYRRLDRATANLTTPETRHNSW